ncbi:PAS domain S-box protein [Candidatus Peregrinibacteria bacterium]|nr:PAS domain S-box protein [Candidatus Peregrinibacteria bacterium]
MASLFTNRKMFVIATCMFLITMSSVLFIVGEEKIAHEIDHTHLQAFILQHEEAETSHDEQFYRDLIDNRDDEFAIINTDRSIKYISPKLEEIHHITLDTNQPLNVLTLIHPKDLTQLANTLMDYNKDPKKRSGIGPIRVQTSSGTYIDYLITLIPVFDEEGEKVLSAVVVKDISTPLGEQLQTR